MAQLKSEFSTSSSTTVKAASRAIEQMIQCYHTAALTSDFSTWSYHMAELKSMFSTCSSTTVTASISAIKQMIQCYHMAQLKSDFPTRSSTTVTAASSAIEQIRLDISFHVFLGFGHILVSKITLNLT
jgi:hypothetical protein